MDGFVFFSGVAWVMVLPVMPMVVYVTAYMVFRCWGKLRVNAAGWHASGIECGSRVVLSALRLLGVFQPLMRLESGLFRRVKRLVEDGEQGVSEVVVELVPLP